jgi:hypothetical protein
VTKRPPQTEDWSDQSAALFDAARGAHAPTAADRERVRDALSQKVAAISSAPASGDVQASGPGIRLATHGKLFKVGVGIACALVGAGAFMLANAPRERPESKTIAVRNQPGPMPAQHAAVPEVSAADSATTPSAAPAPVMATAPAAVTRSHDTPDVRPAARRSPVSTPARVSAPAHVPERLASVPIEQAAPVTEQINPSPRPDAAEQSVQDSGDPRAELEFMERINAALRKSSPQTVLALCAEHERRWPHGVFEPEREGARAIASCSANEPNAGTRAHAFLAKYPRTATAARVRAQCAPLL